MYYSIVVIVVLAAILLCGIVLIQESKGGGLASSVSEANSMMGVRKTTDFVEKATWTLAIVMIVLSVLSVAFIPESSNGSVITNEASNQATSATNMPAIPQTTAAPAATEEAAPAATEEAAPAATEEAAAATEETPASADEVTPTVETAPAEN